MSNKIEIGEYIRTKEGYIGILIAINKQDYNYLVIDTSRRVRNDEYPATYLYLKNEDILKHSKNITDLIEEGDYVNGYKVIESKKSNIRNNGILILVYRNHQYEQWEIIFENEVKSILTHKQFETHSYKVGV